MAIPRTAIEDATRIERPEIVWQSDQYRAVRSGTGRVLTIESVAGVDALDTKRWDTIFTYTKETGAIEANFDRLSSVSFQCFELVAQLLCHMGF